MPFSSYQQKMETVDFEHLNLLLQSPSKEAVLHLCEECFLHRLSSQPPQGLVNSTTKQLNIKPFQAKQLLESLRKLIKNAVFQGSTKPKDVAALFPENFNKNLRDLLGRILIENLPKWTKAASSHLLSLPKLVDFDWRVDIKTSADTVNRMSVPACLLQLEVEELVTKSGQIGEVNTVNVELSKETLDTMLDGLGKIRDQLTSVAKTQS